MPPYPAKLHKNDKNWANILKFWKQFRKKLTIIKTWLFISNYDRVVNHFNAVSDISVDSQGRCKEYDLYNLKEKLFKKHYPKLSYLHFLKFFEKWGKKILFWQNEALLVECDD